MRFAVGLTGVLALLAVVRADVNDASCDLVPGSEADAPATLFKLTDAARSDNAVCLDGTPGAYYFRPGSGSGANKWYIHHQGGGWCNSVNNCAGRALTDLGSSKNYPASAGLGGGYFSQSEKLNPLMYNWNSVRLQYCDGGSFSGAATNSVPSTSGPLHFRGHHVLKAVMSDLLRNRGLSRSTDVVISGCSAGGLATFLHVDEWRAALPANARVVGMPDSGFFLDFEGPPKYHTNMRWVFEHMNATVGVNTACIAAHKATKDEYKCFFAEHTSPFIKTPIFPLQSVFDSWQLNNVLGSHDVATVNQFGQNVHALMVKNLLSQRQHGAFVDSCLHHCGLWDSIKIDGDLQEAAFTKWYNAPTAKQVWHQNKQFNCTACCAP